MKELTNTIRVLVTEKDAKDAKEYGNIEECLLATALKRRGYSGLSVGSDEVHFYNSIYRFTKVYTFRDNNKIVQAYKRRQSGKQFKRFLVTLTRAGVYTHNRSEK